MFDFNTLPAAKRHLRRVNLGSGNSPSANHINIDYFDGENVDITHNLTQRLPFPSGSIDEFYSHHVLEHFNRPDFYDLVHEIHRCLKAGGRFVSRLPDAEASMVQFLELPPGLLRDNMLACLMGGNALGWKPADAHKHFMLWTCDTISSALEECGFLIVTCKRVGSQSSIPVIDFTVLKPGGATEQPRRNNSKDNDMYWGERKVEVPWLLSTVKPGSLLDIGSAESGYITKVIDLGCTPIVLNDIRSFAAFNTRDDVTCVVGDIRQKTPEDLGKFDNILCISTLEHIGLDAYDQRREVPRDDSGYYPQRAAFHHMMKFLAKDGQMLLTVPYGKFEDAGWVLTYDAGMIEEIKVHYEIVEETYFTMTDRIQDTWVRCNRDDCALKGMDSYNGGMRAHSVVCLVLKNK